MLRQRHDEPPEPVAFDRQRFRFDGSVRHESHHATIVACCLHDASQNPRFSTMRPVTDKNASLFLTTACKLANSQHSLLIDDLGSFVAALKSNGMSAPEILETQKLLDRGGLVKVYPAISNDLQVFEITSKGLERFFIDQYGLVGYNKKLGNVARLKHERLLRGVRVTSDSIAEELNVSPMLVHHVLTIR